MRPGLASTRVVAASWLTLAASVTACGDTSMDREPVEVRTIEQAVCPDPPSLCAYYVEVVKLCPAVGAGEYVTGYCESTPPYRGENCADGAHGAEIVVTEDADAIAEGRNPLWLARHDGNMEGISCDMTVDHPSHPHGTWLEMPEAGHCATTLDTGEHYYLEFFASTENCHGWTECRCY